MRKRVAVIGATGIACQQFLVALDEHPWFEVVMLAASERSAGRRTATRSPTRRPAPAGGGAWEEPPARVLDLPVASADGLDVAGLDVVFSAVESDAARALEPQYAKTTPVLSTAPAFRYADDVPIMEPGVNHAAHAGAAKGAVLTAEYLATAGYL